MPGFPFFSCYTSILFLVLYVRLLYFVNLTTFRYIINFLGHVKRSLVISNKNGIYEMHHGGCRTTENLESYEIRKYQENFKTLWNYSLVSRKFCQ